ncbi:hypothetical protein [Ornithinimicrobium kibberense]|uniref:Uncharacterized protein n=2 Tax=Ornithinimicrobium kibberense TaxID=282060 RepID=A0ABV5V4V2_9MICO|nr:hypothetical protein [Ornithinimicrobium kibberense]
MSDWDVFGYIVFGLVFCLALFGLCMTAHQTGVSAELRWWLRRWWWDRRHGRGSYDLVAEERAVRLRDAWVVEMEPTWNPHDPGRENFERWERIVEAWSKMAPTWEGTSEDVERWEHTRREAALRASTREEGGCDERAEPHRP